MKMAKLNGFLTSTIWAKIRADIFHVRGGKCERCHKPGKQVHHLTYERYGGDEEPDDLVLLCGTCHMAEHGLAKVKKKYYPPKLPTNPKSIARKAKKDRKKARAKAVAQLAKEYAALKEKYGMLPPKYIVRKHISKTLNQAAQQI